MAPPPKQLEIRKSEPARRLVYRSSGDSRYLVIHQRRFKQRASSLHMLGDCVEYGWTNSYSVVASD